MPVQLTYTTPATGAPATYHVVNNVRMDAKLGTTVATVTSYVDQPSFAAGKFPLYTQDITLATLPGAADAFDFSYAQLVLPAPTDGTAVLGTRYTFAGGTLVE
jgi:hypothetical protein